MKTVQIEDELYTNIKEYCKLNNLPIGSFINSILKKSFLIEKYGDTPFTNFDKKTVGNIEEIPESKQDITDNHFSKMLDKNKVIEVPDEIKPEFEENIKEVLIQPEPLYTIEDVVKTNETLINKPKKRRLK